MMVKGYRFLRLLSTYYLFNSTYGIIAHLIAGETGLENTLPRVVQLVCVMEPGFCLTPKPRFFLFLPPAQA